jgi:anaerobic magnesium-protoporphyrin IX monomethyl ester cyclase
MRIVLLYPPPWKIAAPGGPPFAPDGPPSKSAERILTDGDFLTAPYGLLSLAAQARRAGHQVVIINCANFPWKDITLLVRHLEAELYGLSCHTANRRGLAMLARLIREAHPEAHIVAGGPFVTGLPGETLEHYPDIDTVVMGEGEETFLELIQRLEQSQSLRGLAGAAWRQGGCVHVGPPRRRITDLDALASPLEYFPLSTLITSRGCPGECTYCASRVMWGRKVTFHSAGYVLEMIRKALVEHDQRVLSFKDDTFTANRQRTLDICKGIREQNLNFVWSCDTRVDTLDEELLHYLRLAGCQRLSLGVESGSPLILKNIKKRVSPEMVLDATRLAKDYGFEIRFYLMVFNRGETLETFRRSFDLLEAARPHEVIFSPLAIYPGTEEFELWRSHGGEAEIFFRENFVDLGPALGDPEEVRQIYELMEAKAGAKTSYTLAELQGILQRLPQHPGVHLDVSGAYFREGKWSEAEKHAKLAMNLGYPLAGLALNYLACIAAARGAYDEAMINLVKAYKSYPHRIVMQNLERLAAWHQAGGPGGGVPLGLRCDNSFELNFINRQPESPGPVRLKNHRQEREYLLGPESEGDYHQGEPMQVDF